MQALRIHPEALTRLFFRCMAGLMLPWLSACTTLGEANEADAINRSDWAKSSLVALPGAAEGWSHLKVGNRPVSSYVPTRHQGRPAIRARSTKGDSMLRLALTNGGVPAGRLRFSWFVPQLNPEADLQDRHRDDAVVRTILQFDGNRAPWSAGDRRLSEWIRLATGEPMPHATLMYVWDTRLPVGTVLSHPRTNRIRLVVVASGPAQLGQWVDIERDIHADYLLAFGKPPQRLTGIGLMSDANNTGHATEAWYGPLQWAAQGD